MAITQTLFGTSRSIPERREQNWGAEVTQLLSDITTCLEGAFDLLSAIPVSKASQTDTTIAAAGTLTQTHHLHRLTGSGGAVTVNTTTAIADGDNNGQTIILEGSDATNTVTIQDGANTDLNGDVVLGLGSAVTLLWNSTRSVWLEVSRRE